jgi:predicted transcriptional regulator
MRDKDAVRAMLDRLPEDCSLEQILYHVYVMQCIEEGDRDIREGRVIPHEEVMQELWERWERRNGGAASSGRDSRERS